MKKIKKDSKINNKNDKKDYRKYILIGVISLVVIVFIIVFITTKPNKNQKPKNEEPQGTTLKIPQEPIIKNVDYDNMDNAKIDGKGNKVCTSKDLTKKHSIMDVMTNEKSDLTVNNVKIYSDKKKDIIYAELPITNEGETTLKSFTLDIMFYDNNNMELHRNNYYIEEIKPKETYVIKIDHPIYDITNTNSYKVRKLD